MLASVTANNPKHGEGHGTPTLKTQSVELTEGDGRFSLILYMPYDGNPHVSLYPASPARGESFANVYLGTGGSVLKKGWWDRAK